MFGITNNISNICKKLNISYTSKYVKKLKEHKKDAQKLADIYIQLKQIISELYDLQEKYPELSKEFDIDIFDLNKTDHHLIQEANKIIKEKK